MLSCATLACICTGKLQQSLHAPLLLTYSAVSTRSLTLLDLPVLSLASMYKSTRHDCECIHLMLLWTKWNPCFSDCR